MIRCQLLQDSKSGYSNVQHKECNTSCVFFATCCFSLYFYISTNLLTENKVDMLCILTLGHFVTVETNTTMNTFLYWIPR